MNFAFIDWFIVSVYLLSSLAIGVIGKKYVSNISHYIVAGRELGLYVGISTLAATEIGTITFMYYAEMGYKYGFAAFIAALIAGVVMIVIGRTGFIISRFRQLKLMTVPEYFEVKYSRGLRILSGILVAVGGILNMGVFLKVEGEFLTIVTGLNARYLVAVMTVILLLELVYTVLGGMVSIVITDFMQYALLSVATILVSLYAVSHVGWGAMVDKIATTMGEAGFNPLVSPKLGLSFVIWQVLGWVASSTCWQTTAMRVFSMKTPELSKKVMTWTGFIFLGRGMLPMLWGIAALTLLGTGPMGKDGIPVPVVNGQAALPVEAMPTMLALILGPGVRGIVVAGMLAATMSVNSSYLLGWSSVISQDIILPLRSALGKGALSSRQQMFLNRMANLFVSLFVMFWGLFYKIPGTVFLYLQMTATIFMAGTFASAIGGLYWRRANTAGAYAAMALGGAAAFVPFFFFHWNENITALTAYGLAGAGMVVGSLVSRRYRSAYQGAVEANP